MDRRDFLKTTGAAAVTAGATASAATAAETDAKSTVAAPSVLPGAERLVLGSAWGPDMARPNVERLAHTLEKAMGGRYRIEVQPAIVDADLVFASAHDQASLHPAFAYFAGLPAGLGIDAAALPIWLGVGGGQMLWDEMAAAFGWKSLLAGHTGASAGLWTSRRIETAQDFAGLKIATVGLACDVVSALGAEAVAPPPHVIKAGLAGGRLHAAEWPGPLAALAPNLQPVAERLYSPAFAEQGMALGLNVSRRLWEHLGAADQAIIEACAAQEYQLSLSEAWAHESIVQQMSAPGKWPVRQALPQAVGAAVLDAAHDVVAGLAATDAESRRIGDSLEAFRSLTRPPVTA